MSNTDEIMKRVKKEFGQHVAKKGNEGYEDTPRLPTGIFAFDLASGGGFPMGRVSIVYGPESSNKCHAKGTKILMWDGTLKNVEDVAVGDKVMGVDSTPRNVVQAGTGHGMLYRITPVKGADPFIVNADHVLSLVCTHNQGNRKKGDIVNISLRDYMGKSKDWKIYHHLYRVGVEFPEQRLPIDPYFLGLWLGDDSKNAPSITTKDTEIVDWLQNYADQQGWELRVYEAENRCPSYAVVGERQGNAKESYPVPSTVLTKMGVFRNKHIPQEYKANSRSNRLELLAGLLDSDGHKGSCSSMGFSNTDLRLCEDVLFVARSLGFYASLSENHRTVNGEPYVSYSVYLSGDLGEIPLRLDRKKPDTRKRTGSPLTSRFTIEELHEDTFYGFQLDGDHLYLLDSFIVNHNTNVVLKAIGEGQKLYPDKKAVFVDAESSYDESWAQQLGVDTENLIVINPEYAEQAVDIIEAFLYAQDVFLVALDSIAALATQNEIESSAEKAAVGGASLVVGKLFKKATVSFTRMRNQGIMPPAFIGINQIRHRIGVMYGNPECLHADTLVNFADGTSHRIQDVVDNKMEGPVWAFDETTQEFKACKILSHHYNGKAKDGEFLTIKAKGYDTKNGVFSMTASITHNFYTDKGWVRAQDLKVGDQLVTKIESSINGSLKEFLLGTGCGDSTLTLNNGGNGTTACLRLEDTNNPDYVKWKVEKLAPLFTMTEVPNDTGGVRYVSPSRTDLRELRNELLGGRSPLPLLDSGSWLGMALWVMDDGHYDKGHGRYIIAMGRYSGNKEVQGLIDQGFNKMGLEGAWSVDGKNYTLTVDSSARLANQIAKYVPEPMRYKLPEGAEPYQEFELEFETKFETKLTPILEVGEASPRKYRNRQFYDIHVEDCNTYSIGNQANGVVVHNTMPGGNSLKFAASFIVRLYGKNEMDKKINAVMPAYKKTSIIIQKWKMPILATTAEFMMQMLDGAGNKAGHVEDWNTIAKYLRELDYLHKGDKSGWIMFGEEYKTLQDCKDALFGNHDFLHKAKQQIIQEMMEAQALEEGEAEGEAEGDVE